MTVCKEYRISGYKIVCLYRHTGQDGGHYIAVTMYLCIKSSDCLDIFPHNKASAFKVRIPCRVSSRVYSRCCLVSLSIPPLKDGDVEEILVLVNFVKESIVGATKLPIVYRYVSSSNALHLVTGWHSIYLPLRNIDTDVIDIKLVNGRNYQLVDIHNGVCYCTFHFLKL